ncbi:hypothetical protein F511_05939 [Dorcoceras hygrometricum]|uniref:Uncharacterized protein n=1 Tax=Dorcoceras hygrometricum TaxID=472368 RepID=A0A2Z7DHC6_9LAMI|nr:hypothetical protein F511_05939 [Dorcoceras hygrometricum]
MAPTPTIFNCNHEEYGGGTPFSPRLRPLSAARRSIPSHTPYTSPLHFKGIPFSWEKIPGIPKYQESHNISKSTRSLLPLPPAAIAASATSATKTDPFLVALVECSKDDHHATNFGHVWKGSSKNFITRTLSDSFGFISIYGSCKRSRAVSESIVYLPRSST